MLNLISSTEEKHRKDRPRVGKYDSARMVLTRMNEGGDALLAARRGR